MNVLTVFAHPGSRSFCHAVLDRLRPDPAPAGYAELDAARRSRGKVARADALAFVTADAWRGDINGRRPRLALIKPVRRGEPRNNPSGDEAFRLLRWIRRQ
jgi:hypothetical protein